METQRLLKHCSWTSHGLLMDLSMTALGFLRTIPVLWAMIYVSLNPLFTMSQMNQEMYGATGKVGNKTYYQRDGKTIGRIIVTPKNPKTDAQTLQRILVKVVAKRLLFPIVSHRSNSDGSAFEHSVVQSYLF